jgi:hypothetical protein
MRYEDEIEVSDNWSCFIKDGIIEQYNFYYERKLRIRVGSPMKQPFEMQTTRLTH